MREFQARVAVLFGKTYGLFGGYRGLVSKAPRVTGAAGVGADAATADTAGGVAGVGNPR